MDGHGLRQKRTFFVESFAVPVIFYYICEQHQELLLSHTIDAGQMVGILLVG